MIDTTIATSVDSLHLSLHDSMVVILRESSAWTRSDWIALVSAVAVFLAAGVALFGPFMLYQRQKRDQRQAEIIRDNQIRTSILMGIREHLRFCELELSRYVNEKDIGIVQTNHNLPIIDSGSLIKLLANTGINQGTLQQIVEANGSLR